MDFVIPELLTFAAGENYEAISTSCYFGDKQLAVN